VEEVSVPIFLEWCEGDLLTDARCTIPQPAVISRKGPKGKRKAVSIMIVTLNLILFGKACSRAAKFGKLAGSIATTHQTQLETVWGVSGAGFESFLAHRP
jgi:hypothetical protein